MGLIETLPDWLLVRAPGALAVNLALALAARKAGAITRSGALAGMAYGIAVYLALGGRGYALMALFVVLGSAFTRVGLRRKRAEGTAQEHGGARTWRHASANLAVGALVAVAAAASGQEAWVWAFVGAMAAALADTTESELGMLAARRAYLPPRMAPVPAGTEGAVSPAGTLLGVAAALVLAAAAAQLGVLPWVAAVPVALAAVAATLVESLLGALRPLSNELLNTLTTAAGALLSAGVWWVMVR